MEARSAGDMGLGMGLLGGDCFGARIGGGQVRGDRQEGADAGRSRGTSSAEARQRERQRGRGRQRQALDTRPKRRAVANGTRYEVDSRVRRLREKAARLAWRAGGVGVGAGGAGSAELVVGPWSVAEGAHFC
jgi:hypothetical protein